MPIVSLTGMQFRALHGFYEEEKQTGGDFEVDLLIDFKWDVDIAEKDQLGETINYEALYLFCQSEMKKPTKLIETVAFRIMERIKNHFGDEKVTGVRIHLKKLHPPLPGKVRYASIEIGHGTLQMSPQQLAFTTTNLVERTDKIMKKL